MPQPSLPILHDQSAQVSRAYLQPLRELVAEHALTEAEWLSAAGLPGVLFSADSISASAYLQLLDSASLLCRDPHLGLHLGERFRLGTYHIYGMILMSCQNFAEAFRQTIRYESLAHDLGRSLLLKQHNTTEYQWHSHFPDASRHLVESVFAGIRTFGHWFAATRLPEVPVCFSHAAPADISEHQRIFGNQVQFAAGRNSASLPDDLLHWPVPNADPGMYPVLQQHAEFLLQQKLSQRQQPLLLTQVSQKIAQHLSQDSARVAVIAAELGLSARTLQRKLAEAGCSFQQLLDQTREQLARHFLANPQLALADIAFLLGYQEQSTFQHAFKEWSGMTPGQYRAERQHSRLQTD